MRAYVVWFDCWANEDEAQAGVYMHISKLRCSLGVQYDLPSPLSFCLRRQSLPAGKPKSASSLYTNFSDNTGNHRGLVFIYLLILHV